MTEKVFSIAIWSTGKVWLENQEIDNFKRKRIVRNDQEDIRRYGKHDKSSYDWHGCAYFNWENSPDPWDQRQCGLTQLLWVDGHKRPLRWALP